MIGEGANLGMTQRGRIEFAARGGRINTDFIDNSAGVNTSDQEVNIKIALNAATRSGRLTLAARNKLLGEMTEDVAAASLRNNYQQSLALSLAQRRSARELADYTLLMRSLEAHGLLDRTLEALPSDREMQERARAGRGLTRPELAVLLSYAKIALQDDLLAQRRPRRAAGAALACPILSSSAPRALRRPTSRSTACAARSSRSASPMPSSTGAARPWRCCWRTRPAARRPKWRMPSSPRARCSSCRPLWQRIDALDGQATGEAQLALYQATQDLVAAQTLWFLRNGAALADLAGTIRPAQGRHCRAQARAEQRAARRGAAARSMRRRGSSARAASRPMSPPTWPSSAFWRWRRR